MFDPNIPHASGNVPPNVARATPNPNSSHGPGNTHSNIAGAIHLPNFPNIPHISLHPHADYLYEAITHVFQNPLKPQTASFLLQTQLYPDPQQKQRPKDIFAPNGNRQRNSGRPNQSHRSGAPSPQLPPRPPTPPLSANPLSLLQKHAEDILSNDYATRTIEEIREYSCTNAAASILASLQSSLKAGELCASEPKLPERPAAIPSLKDLAIYYIPVVKPGREEKPFFDGKELDLRMGQKGINGCTWCLFGCSYGISDERTFLPIDAASGFCADCHLVTATFYDEWNQDPNHFVGSRGMGGSTTVRRLGELDKMSNVPPLKEVGVEEGWKEEALRLDAERRKQMGRKPRKEREFSRTDGRDITWLMGPCFCRGCEWRQVDLRKVCLHLSLCCRTPLSFFRNVLLGSPRFISPLSRYILLMALFFPLFQISRTSTHSLLKPSSLTLHHTDTNLPRLPRRKIQHYQALQAP